MFDFERNFFIFLFSGPVIYNMLLFSIGNFPCGPLVTVSCQDVCLFVFTFGYDMKCNSCTSVMILSCGIFYSSQCLDGHGYCVSFWKFGTYNFDSRFGCFFDASHAVHWFKYSVSLLVDIVMIHYICSVFTRCH